MVAKKSTLKGIIFILILIVLVMGYSMYTTSIKNKKVTYDSSEKGVSEQEVSSKSDSISDTSTQTTENTSTVSEQTPKVTSDTQDKCEKDFLQNLKTKNTEYEKGRILVGFNKDISFSKAQSVVSRYDLVPVLAGVDEESYSLTRLLTVNVPTGKEAHFVCMLKADSSVRYSNISAYLFLHD